MKKIFLLLISAVLYNSSRAQTNINISNYTFNNNFDDTEPYIAVNPISPNDLIAAWMKVTGVPVMSIATSYSTNGGQSWSTPANMPSLHNNFFKADVSIAYGGNGTAYICYIDYDPAFDSGYVMVASSINNGQTWSNPVKAISGLESPDLPVDRPWIAVDQNNGKIYVVSKSAEAGALPHHIWMKTSSDGGLTWTPRLQIDNPSTVGLIYNSMGTLDVGPDGNVYVAYMSYDTIQNMFPRVLLKRSTDGGLTFTEHLIAYPVNGSAINDTLYQGSYCLKVNPTNGNNLVFIVTDARYGDPDILAVYSTNGGLTWNGFSPWRVNNDGQNNGIGQDMCWGGFSPNGIFCAVWRDRRNGGTGSSANFEIYTAASLNGGQTFGPSYRISDQSSPVIPISKGNDFLGVAVTNTVLHTDWCDKRTNNTEIFTNCDSLSAIVTIKELENAPKFSLLIFPNPTTSTIHYIINCDRAYDLAELSITDMQGKILLAEQIGSLQEGENNLIYASFDKGKRIMFPGEYVMKVSIGKSSAVKKFTVIKNE